MLDNLFQGHEADAVKKELARKERNISHDCKLVIHDKNGEPRFTIKTGVLETTKGALSRYLEKCRKHKELMDWSNLDLSNLDFSGEDLSKFYFSGSDFTGSSLDTCLLTGADFSNTILDEASFVKAHSTKQTKFCGASITSSNFYGSDLKGANFRGATLKGVNAQNVNWEKAVATHSEQSEVDYSNSNLSNVDWGRAVVIKSKFKATNMSDNIWKKTNKKIGDKGEHLKGKDFPNKMRSATFVGNEIDEDTKMNDMNKGVMFFDNYINRFTSLSSTMALSIALAAFDGGLSLAGFSALEESLSFGKMVCIVGIVDFFKDKLFQPVLDKVENKLQEKLVEFRKNNNIMENGMRHRASLVALAGQSGGMTPIIKALESVKKKKSNNPLFDLASYIINGKDAIVVCDKRHLAEAIAHISSNRNRDYKIAQNITLVRPNPETNLAGIPSTVTFNKDGTTTMTWVEEGKTKFAVEYDCDGVPVKQIDVEAGRTIPLEEMAMPGAADLFSSLDAFEKQILKENDLQDFSYDKKMSYVVAGENGSLMVHKIANRELHNREGPAVITLGGDRKNPSWHSETFFIDGYYKKDKEEFEKSRNENVHMTSLLMKLCARRSKKREREAAESYQEAFSV